MTAGKHAHISLRRTGGIAGLPVQATLDTRELPADQAEQLTAALDAVDLDSIGEVEDWPDGAADTFRYELQVKRDDAVHTASFSERQLPAELAPVVRTLMDRARPAPRRQ